MRVSGRIGCVFATAVAAVLLPAAALASLSRSRGAPMVITGSTPCSVQDIEAYPLIGGTAGALGTAVRVPANATGVILVVRQNPSCPAGSVDMRVVNQSGTQGPFAQVRQPGLNGTASVRLMDQQQANACPLHDALFATAAAQNPFAHTTAVRACPDGVIAIAHSPTLTARASREQSQNDCAYLTFASASPARPAAHASRAQVQVTATLEHVRGGANGSTGNEEDLLLISGPDAQAAIVDSPGNPFSPGDSPAPPSAAVTSPCDV